MISNVFKTWFSFDLIMWNFLNHLFIDVVFVFYFQIAMRRADDDLAKKLLSLYSEIQRLKMTRSCLNYCRLLDDAFLDAEIADEVPDMCDPPHKTINKLLMERGVTNFNISSRRFSCI